MGATLLVWRLNQDTVISYRCHSQGDQCGPAPKHWSALGIPRPQKRAAVLISCWRIRPLNCKLWNEVGLVHQWHVNTVSCCCLSWELKVNWNKHMTAAQPFGLAIASISWQLHWSSNVCTAISGQFLLNTVENESNWWLTWNEDQLVPRGDISRIWCTSQRNELSEFLALRMLLTIHSCYLKVVCKKQLCRRSFLVKKRL